MRDRPPRACKGECCRARIGKEVEERPVDIGAGVAAVRHAIAKPVPLGSLFRKETHLARLGRAKGEDEPAVFDGPWIDRRYTVPAPATGEDELCGGPCIRVPPRLDGRRGRPIDQHGAKSLEAPPVTGVEELVAAVHAAIIADGAAGVTKPKQRLARILRR
jgi:hypothetical protein